MNWLGTHSTTSPELAERRRLSQEYYDYIAAMQENPSQVFLTQDAQGRDVYYLPQCNVDYFDGPHQKIRKKQSSLPQKKIGIVIYVALSRAICLF